MGATLQKSDYTKIRKTTLRKLYSAGAFSKGHLLFERLKSGIPPHLIGFVQLVVNELVEHGMVKVYGKTKHGLAYQLNIDKINEIETELGIK